MFFNMITFRTLQLFLCCTIAIFVDVPLLTGTDMTNIIIAGCVC